MANNRGDRPSYPAQPIRGRGRGLNFPYPQRECLQVRPGLVSEGTWVESESKPGSLEFVSSEAPSPDEVCALLERIQSRIVKHLTRLGLIKEGLGQAETSGALELESGEKDQSYSQGFFSPRLWNA